MTWEPELDELRRREELAPRMGGEESVARQRARGKKTVRERVGLLLDEGSFAETGTIAGVGSYAADGTLEDLVPTNFVVGQGRIAGRRVVVEADDFTVKEVGQLFVAGPPVVAWAMHDDVTKEELGGARASSPPTPPTTAAA